MTLDQWHGLSRAFIADHEGAKIVVDAGINAPWRDELFRLDDYAVSSVVAGSIWLVRTDKTSAQRLWEVEEAARERSVADGMIDVLVG